MADDEGGEFVVGSPKEDFNPLAEDFTLASEGAVSHQEYDHDADCSGDSHDDGESSQYNSIDADFNANDLLQYSITPPAHQRSLKRAKKFEHAHMTKEKSPFKGDYKQLLDQIKRTKPTKTPVTIIKERYGDDPTLCKLSGVDSDDNLERESPRQVKDRRRRNSRESKRLTASRSHERFLKQNPAESLENVNSDLPAQVMPVKLESSNRFLSLKSTLVPVTPIDRSETRRQVSMNKIECPENRQKFYDLFSALINLGSHSKKENSKQGDKFTRQLSSEQEVWQNKVNDVIWLEVLAYLQGCSLEEMDNKVVFERERLVSAVLEEIMQFKLDDSDEQDFLDPLVDLSGTAGKSSSKQLFCDNNNSSFDLSPDISASSLTVSLTQRSLDRQRDALVKVRDLLDKLDDCEQWFPTSKAFARVFPLYGDREFVHRLKTLCLWLNITQDLFSKMKLLGKVLSVHTVDGFDWPMMDYESPRGLGNNTGNADSYLHRLSIPEVIEQPSTDSEGEEDSYNSGDDQRSERSLSSKKVKFLVSDSERSSTAGSPLTLTEPADSSTPIKPPSRIVSTSSMTLSRSSSQASLEEQHQTSVYRHFVDKSLKKMGMKKLLLRLRDLLDGSLQRAKEALVNPSVNASSPGDGVTSPVEEQMSKLSTSPSLEYFPHIRHILISRSSSLTEHGAWSEQFLHMGLPSFRPCYLFLVRIPLDVIHETLRLRLEQRPIGDPSPLSIRQLIRECKEVLQGAVIMKQYYQHMVSEVLWDDEQVEEKFAEDLGQFDEDMKRMLEIYFSYLQNRMYMLQNLPEASRSLKNALEEEWTFTKQVCPYIIGGEAEACKRFSTLASSLLNSIADFMESGIDDYTTSLYDLTTLDDDDDDDDDEGLGKGDSQNQEDSYEDHGSRDRALGRASELRHSFQQTCRNFKNLFHEARERASKALGFAKMLRKDLEIAADFHINCETKELMEKLLEKKHVQVIAKLSANYLMFIPEAITGKTQLILHLLNVTCGREDISLPTDLPSKEEGYLLMMRWEGGPDHFREPSMWQGPSVHVEPTAETAIALSHIEVEGLLLVVIHSSQLFSQRREFETMMGPTIGLVNEQTSCHLSISESLVELKTAALDLCHKVAIAIRNVDDRLTLDDTHKLPEVERNHILKLYRETMLQCYNFGFEYHREVARLVTGEQRQGLGSELVKFAQDWMKFVSEKCERGRGMRPRWANQGFEFMIVACEPKVLACLSEQEFKDLQSNINDCTSHVIGSVERSSSWNSSIHGILEFSNLHHSTEHKPYYGLPMTRSSSSELSTYWQKNYSRLKSWPAEPPKIIRSFSSKSVPAESPQSRDKKRKSESNIDVVVHDDEEGGLVLDIHRNRRRASSGDSLSPCSPSLYSSCKPKDQIRLAVEKLERSRFETLRDKRVIGRVTNKRSESDVHVNVRRVNFRWQRGIKIGEGTFGKVYTAVNVDTGELMAMKEMKFQPNDHSGLKQIVDEIKNFEGIKHPNLVKYYGVEVHKDEMLVFMEYCDRGTVEDAAKDGLPESMIRTYTREILVAVNVLHENGIIHRDIKGANIFLTSSGCLKLGDFGCSVKLRSHTTIPGEFSSMEGTTAYMAPEVITKNDKEGHGRAADIWSLGCVVVELASGKRPWHDLENMYQIMFKVGMGGTPPIPDNLSAEGKDFLEHCFQQDPAARYNASQLQDHPFVKVYEEKEGENKDL